MTDETDNHNNESFAEMLESYSKQLSASVNVGDRIKGKVIALSKDSVFIETGTKIDGVADKSEFVGETGDIDVEQGDMVELYVVAATENEIRLSKAMTGDGGLAMIQEAYRNQVPVEGKVRELCKGGLVIDVMNRRAFCPISQIDLAYVENPEAHLNQTYLFLISKLEDKGRNIVVTRRQILQQEQQKAQAEFLENITEGDVIDGIVTRLKPYGAFVELQPGLEGMVHISEMSWSRIDKPDDILKPGDKVQVRVLNLDRQDPNRLPKIGLSVKQTSDNPWTGVDDAFKVGDIVSGRVMRCAEFGAFVEIAPGVEGLVHVSELSYAKRIHKPEDVVTVGETLDVMIKDIDMQRRRIALSVRDAAGDPWAEVETHFKVGSTYEGRIEKKERFGYFVALAPGITGLLPQSKIQSSGAYAQKAAFKTGGPIRVMIDGINSAERKMSLALADEAENAGWRQYSPESPKSMGDLGEKLQAALKAKRKAQ